MNFCKECGNQLKSDSEFCPECGAAVHKETTQEKKSEAAPQNKPTRKTNKEKKPITKKQKVIAISGLSAILVLVAGLVTLSTINSPERAVSGIVESIEVQDTEAVAEQIYFEEEDRNLTTGEAEKYIGYFENNTERFEKLKKDLAEQAELMEDKEVVSEYDSLEDAFTDHGLNDELSIKHTDGTLIDETEFNLTPSYVSISTNLPDSELTDENGEELFTFTEEETVYTVGPLVRGEYNFVVTHTGKWVDLTEVLGLEVSQPEQEISAEFDVDYVTFVGGFDEDVKQKLVINGQEIENPPLNEEIGPLQLNEQSTYEYIAELPWGEMSTGEQPLEETEVELELANNQALADQLAEALEVFYDTVLESFLTDDTNLLTIVSSDLRKYHAERIDTLHENLETKDTSFNALHFGDYQVSDSISEIKHDWTDTWRLSLPVFEEYLFFGTEEKLDIADDEYEKNVWMYEFIYEEDEWKLDGNISTGLMVDTENYFDYSFGGEIAVLEDLEEEDEGDGEEENSSETVSEGKTEQLVQKNLREMQDAYEAYYETLDYESTPVTEEIIEPEKDTDETKKIVDEVVEVLSDYVAEDYIDDIARGFLYEYFTWAHGGDGLFNDGNIDYGFEVIDEDEDTLTISFYAMGSTSYGYSTYGGKWQLEYEKDGSNILLSGSDHTNLNELGALTYEEIQAFHAKDGEEIELIEEYEENGEQHILIEVLNTDEEINRFYYNLDKRLVDIVKSETEDLN